MGLPLSDALAPLHEAPRGDVQQQVRVLWGGVLGGVRGISGLKRRPGAPPYPAGFGKGNRKGNSNSRSFGSAEKRFAQDDKSVGVGAKQEPQG